MDEYRQQRLWKSDKRKRNVLSDSKGGKGVQATPERQRYPSHSDNKLTSKSHFGGSSNHSQVELRRPRSSLQRLSHSVSNISFSKSSPRPHSSLGSIHQGSPHQQNGRSNSQPKLSLVSPSKQTLRSHSSLGFTQQGRPRKRHRLESHSRPSLSRPVSSLSSPRPHTSLGFTRQGSPHHHEYGLEGGVMAPHGFDIAGYVREHGATSGVHIGVNGRETHDEYLMVYIDDCKRLVLVDGKGEFPCDSDDDDVTMMSFGDHVRAESVPLCWDDQLKRAEPRSVKSAAYANNSFQYRSNRATTHIHTNHKQQDDITLLQDLLHHQQTVSVMVSWNSTTLLQFTSLQELREGRKTTTIPQPDYTITERDSESDEGSDSSSAVSAPSVDSAVDLGTTMSSRLSRGDGLEELMSSLVNAAPGFSAKSLFCIWFRSAAFKIKELSKMDFDMFLTSSASKVFSKTEVISISNTTAVIPLHLESRDLFSERGAITLCVMCSSPRSVLFTIRLKLPQTVESHTTTPDTLSERDGHTAESASFFKRRHYQEEDEDKTDMEALARYFPDLKLLDLVEWEEGETTPILSPLHQHVERLNAMTANNCKEGEPLSSMSSLTTLQHRDEAYSSMSSTATQTKSEPLSSTISMATQNRSESLSSTISMATQNRSESLSSTISMATQHRGEPLSSSSNNDISPVIPDSQLPPLDSPYRLQYTHHSRRPLYRPHTKQLHRDSFVSIVGQWLGPYV